MVVVLELRRRQAPTVLLLVLPGVDCCLRALLRLLLKWSVRHQSPQSRRHHRLLLLELL
jgi:hypothetical protein